MKSVYYILLCVYFASAMNFDTFVEKYDKKYSCEEEYKMRERVFSENIRRINDHKDYIRRNDLSYDIDVNHMADLTREEYKSMLWWNRWPKQEGVSILGAAANKTVNWTALGAVTPVKDQGRCGSCWSFSATGSIEGAWFVKHGELVSLSEQELMDCSKNFGDNSCEGGLMDNAFNYVMQSGLCKEEDYPYLARDENVCKTCAPAVRISKFVDVKKNCDSCLEAAIFLNPVSVAVEADTVAFQFYKSGVLNDVHCGTNLDHGVLAVGYGPDYFLVKNSWSSSWGDNGYIKIGRSNAAPQGICGILMDPSYPIAA